MFRSQLETAELINRRCYNAENTVYSVDAVADGLTIYTSHQKSHKTPLGLVSAGFKTSSLGIWTGAKRQAYDDGGDEPSITLVVFEKPASVPRSTLDIRLLIRGSINMLDGLHQKQTNWKFITFLDPALIY